MTYISLFERYGCLPSLLTDGVTSAKIANKFKPQTTVFLGHISCAGWEKNKNQERRHDIVCSTSG
jgi:hypothetical protein